MRLFSAGLLGLALLVSACDSGTPATASVRYAVSGPAAVTFTDASGATATATTASAWETELSVAPGAPVVLAATSASGQPLTASIYVDGQLAKSSHGAQVRLSTSSSSSSTGEIEVEGLIESISADRITVLGLDFALDGQTQFLDDNNDVALPSAFAVGMRVEVKGRATGGGTFRATRVKPDDNSYDDDGSDDNGGVGQEVEIHGTIGAIDAESMTVNGTRFVTTASTRYLDDDNNPLARSAFQTGDLAEAEGHRRSDGTIVANKIKRDDD